jgi:hypothetical protein
MLTQTELPWRSVSCFLESLHETAESSLLVELKGRLEALRECSGDGCQEAEDSS